ncbi:S-adenosyl-L-methionine-dependent methyltransferase [Ramaria rubella]|nr:S-adenosyl-L-methionine-dependent methyltransferase [Ramaria rubella]
MGSPAPSVYSLTSSLREQSFRQEYGREVNSYSEVYRLPADEEEVLRLDKQHRMFKIMMGQWVPPLPDVLSPEPGITKSVLDLGCGSGAWIADVARAFPECSAVGVDLAPVQTLPMPPNCRTEVDDINLGLEHFYDSFDVVHTRLVSSGIRDYAGLINHMVRCLRPRGLIVLYEFDFRLYHPDTRVAPPWSTTCPPEEATYLCRWFGALRRAVAQRGGDVDAATHLHTWILQHDCFSEDEVTYCEYWLPTAPSEYQKEWGVVGKHPKEVGELMREDLACFLRSGRPLLFGNGISPAEVNILETNAARELQTAEHPLFARVQCVYARKKAVG